MTISLQEMTISLQECDNESPKIVKRYVVHKVIKLKYHDKYMILYVAV